MRKSVVFLVFAMLTVILSGCIISKTPSTNNVTIRLGEQMKFSVDVFPSNATYIWTLDGSPLTNTEESYVYTALGGDHILVVNATHVLGTDIQAWKIMDPITSLFNSMVNIPGGTFMMGSMEQSPYSLPVHAVTLQSFNIGAYEVTQTQYAAVMGTNPSYFQWTNYPDTENNPVEQVSWNDARAFCTTLSAMTGRTFTLPSEAQWEYACRAGTTSLYSFGDSDALLGIYAWYCYNSDSIGGPYGTHPVGTRLPNAWGLYDMHGNVNEWCQDFTHGNYTGAPTDGSAWMDTDPLGQYDGSHVNRGGSWLSTQVECTSALRGTLEYNYKFNYLGFRIVELISGN